MHFKMPKKIQIKNLGIHMKNVYPCKKFHIEKTFCVAGIKRQKKCYVQSHFGTPEICLFYTGHKKCLFIPIFFMNIECSYVHPKFWFEFFKHFKIHFLRSGCRYTYDPKWISRNERGYNACLTYEEVAYKVVAAFTVLQ